MAIFFNTLYLINISVFGLYDIVSHSRQLLPTLKHLKSQLCTYLLRQSSLASTVPTVRIQGSGIGVSTFYPTNFPECIETQFRQNSLRVSLKPFQQSFRNGSFSFFFFFFFFHVHCRSSVPPLLFFSTCLTFLFNIF